VIKFLNLVWGLAEKLRPITQHPNWQPFYHATSILLALIAAVNTPGIRRAALMIIMTGLVVTVVFIIVSRRWTVALQSQWIVLCMRHHSPFFEPLMYGIQLLRRTRPGLYVYHGGTLLEHLSQEQYEHRHRFNNISGYLLSFDIEAREILREGITIGTLKYRIQRLSDLGLKRSNDFMKELELDPSVADIFSRTQFQEYARPLFWGLSGVVLKYKPGETRVGGHSFQNENGLIGVSMLGLLKLLNDQSTSGCPIFIVNWPVLLLNMCAISEFGETQVAPAQKTTIDRLIDQLRSAVANSSVIVSDNPYYLHDKFREVPECIVIGGGTWLTFDSNTRLCPILGPFGRSYVLRYLECFGFLLPEDLAIGPAIEEDAHRVDKWLELRIPAELLRDTRQMGLPLIGYPCWRRLDKSKSSDSTIVRRFVGDKTEVLDRRIPTAFEGKLPALFDIR
jgi:hypothetical protein